MALSAYLREGINVAIIMGAGDVIAQLGLEKKSFKEYNVGRTLRFSALGMCVVGPSLKKWYTTLDGLVPKDQPALQRAVKKMVIDQACFAPVFTLILSYLVPLVNGVSHDEIVRRLQQTYLTIMKHSYIIWPLAQMINFTFIPVAYQVLYVQFVSVVWNCYLSLIFNKKE